MALLNESEIQSNLATLPHWQREGDTIQKVYKFKNFIEAIAFVNKLVEPSETAGHHPDLSISYNKVTVNLTTHDAGGLTKKDFSLAETFEKL
ncbi:4a-hydroxytetrahydrobiopterin dehydratase [[Limnothrix rosea] IAM M-220]|uniref:4a-hydroxytetrahydrobiopterin dehydratase n=1 Tax=[Limnothrix rosea] IAM M-220 TaxID=454133 RepID=UPI00096047EE|nr:4a-hydroxytetrahydrobiopterin dehydratase [[Limnothrix rosea] IAM M-220]OKH13159.1 4a-hydroxytetrahydrobiopterin dehydratase [[Limnothrix rosea] IAM M-220]